jgi:glycosyltransferase involved in cell wall biosynthesis
MTTLNAERTLPAALASLRAQTFADWELLVMDGASADRTGELASAAAAVDARIHVVPGGSGLGRSDRLNHLLDMAESPLLAIMDADDVAYPQRLERQVEYLLRHEEVDLVGSPLLVFGIEGRAIGKRSAPPAHAEICARPWAGFRLFQPTWLGRAEWFRTYRYSPNAVRCEDQDLLYRAYRSSVFANLGEPLLGYREERPMLRKLLRGRWYWTRLTAVRLCRERQLGAALELVGTQLAKATVDVLARAAGLDPHVSRLRVGPMSEAEAEEWHGVWYSLDPATPPRRT